jgi:ABC-2 type transport system ATP-binding protein
VRGNAPAVSKSDPLHRSRPHDRGTALSLKRVVVRFGSRTIIKGLDLNLDPGERLSLTGRNGSGKSTLLRCIAGTLMPHSGEVLVHGNVAGTPAAARLLGSSLSQERSFYHRLSGRQNLRFYAGLRGADTSAQATQMVSSVVDELGIHELADKRVDHYSSGMLQRLGFARALLGDPRLIVLDEPTRSLDDAAIRGMWAALDRRAGSTLIIASHRGEDTARCHRNLTL